MVQGLFYREQTGLLRPFSTISADGIDKLESAANTGSSALAEFRKISTAELFPKSVPIVLLTAREHKVLALPVRGMRTSAMSNQLHVSVNTVKSQLHSLYKKFDVHTRDEATAKAHALNLVQPCAPRPGID